ncbi:DegV family protein [Chondromyces apiculatus]|uniref:DegV family protein n=1 Tax=Chondromyces apiculatus DSM 436 TaxID=1192034 RepID=A0A017T601_9BACT|nr:DegV family protein [Chondromyces apiculatus]EYF04629.1 DegV family protein [Chondromyces apiculatus DSM 436]
MIIVTNPGSNLPAAVVERYGILVAPQQIVVDGVAHDTRHGVDMAMVEGWVRSAKEHPHVVGTTAAEFVSVLRGATRQDREVLVIMTSRKIIGSFDAAQVAARTLLRMTGNEGVRVVVCDTGVTDAGAGMACILAGEARAAGLSLDEVVQLLDAYRTQVRFGFLTETLEYLVKGGRATALRALLANVLGVRPLVAFNEGELRVVAKVSTKVEPGEALAQWVEGSLGPGRRIWAAIFHGGVPERAVKTAVALRKRLDVSFLWIMPLSPSIYLHTGPGAVGVAVVPLSVLPWWPDAAPLIG